MRYLTEVEIPEKDKNLGKYLRAAIKHKDTGELYRGPSILSSHFETRQHHGLGPEHEAGFIDKRDPKVFISREDAAKRGAGSETTENLSSWGKYRRAIGLRPDDPDAAGGSLSSGDLAPKNSIIGNLRRLNLREKKDFMIAFRQKIDAKRLAPTRSGSKGGSADGGE
jgi:hypothetical protein